MVHRSHKDVTETHPFFHPYAKDGRVYLIKNDATNCGLDLPLQRFQELVESLLQQKNSDRTSNDGLRLGSILLDNQYRGSVAGIMTKKKDRKKSDIPGDPTTHFFEMVLKEAYMKPEYKVAPPAKCCYNEFPEEEKAKWDPNDPTILDHSQNGVLLRATWEEYLRPKYKRALDRWNKDTGGGDGTATSFINFCGADRWLVYLFCKDLEANFLLASSAGG